MAGGVSASGTGAPPQAGILDGVNPIVYNPANPIILFIVQASGPFPDGPPINGHFRPSPSPGSYLRAHRHLRGGDAPLRVSFRNPMGQAARSVLAGPVSVFRA